ncbi:hypothetical protein PHJA_001761300 [Phtheirospermum japonicum]|uniref:Uncharacterized protein n=1 Tax=Phtheirospermum japonicum TaxID=374723 RepID=A0A830CCX2_9LAMI|nr:hypothetical protein PHJA_001761300 [Phtheirospermum japonicum]
MAHFDPSNKKMGSEVRHQHRLILAVDAAALVIQHPSGKLERMYWPITATEVMRANPGHYVSLIIPLPLTGGDDDNSGDNKTIRFTRVKLLRPTDTLVLGRAYRLVTTQEVMKVLRAKKHAKMKKNISESGLQTESEKQSASSESENYNQGIISNRHRQRTGSANLAAGKPKLWRPSLQSITEGGS